MLLPGQRLNPLGIIAALASQFVNHCVFERHLGDELAQLGAQLQIGLAAFCHVLRCHRIRHASAILGHHIDGLRKLFTCLLDAVGRDLVQEVTLQ